MTKSVASGSFFFKRIGDLVHPELQIRVHARGRDDHDDQNEQDDAPVGFAASPSSMRGKLLVEGLRVRSDLPRLGAHVVDLSLQNGECHLVQAERRACADGTRERRIPGSVRGNPPRKRSWIWVPLHPRPVTWSRMAWSASASLYPVCLLRMAAAARPCRSSGSRPFPVAEGQAVRLRQQEDLRRGPAPGQGRAPFRQCSPSPRPHGTCHRARLPGAPPRGNGCSRGRERLASTSADALDRQTFLSSIELVFPDICEHAGREGDTSPSCPRPVSAVSPKRRSGERYS